MILFFFFMIVLVMLEFFIFNIGFNVEILDIGNIIFNLVFFKLGFSGVFVLYLNLVLLRFGEIFIFLFCIVIDFVLDLFGFLVFGLFWEVFLFRFKFVCNFFKKLFVFGFVFLFIDDIMVIFFVSFLLFKKK